MSVLTSNAPAEVATNASVSDRTSQAAAKRLVYVMLGAGTMHFLTPKFYDAIVPPQLPGSARTYTYVSGVVEFAVGLALAVPRTRRIGGILATLLFIVVFPANVQMAVDWWRNEKIPLPLKIGAILRLPLQIPLVTQGLKAQRNAP